MRLRSTNGNTYAADDRTLIGFPRSSSRFAARARLLASPSVPENTMTYTL
jgi:hypothetical protein